MDSSALLPYCISPFSEMGVIHGFECSYWNVLGTGSPNVHRLVLMVAKSGSRTSGRKLTKNLRYPRRTKLPPQFGTDRFWKKPLTDTEDENDNETSESAHQDIRICIDNDPATTDEENSEEGGDGIVWESDEIDAISSLFRGRIPQKPGKLGRERPLPLPLPHKIRPIGLPTPKRRERITVSSRESISQNVYKNPSFLIELAKEISSLPTEEAASKVLEKSSRFLRKGSLSLTIRELGRMDLPKRALETFCWAQEQPHLFPDDRILISTVEVLARTRDLKMPFSLQKFTALASRSVIEAMVRGCIKGGSLELARKTMLVAMDGNRMLDSGIYAKLILELGKNPDKHGMVLALLEDLGERDDLNLTHQDCTSIMKVCIRMRKFDIVEGLFGWFKQTGQDPSIVMYTTMVHSRYSEKKFREAMALVWEMESSNCLFDLPAYRVVIKLFVSLDDLPRTVRYFSKLKEAGFSPTYDIYRDVFTVYMASGRVARCKEVCMEAEMAGFVLDKSIRSQLCQLRS